MILRGIILLCVLSAFVLAQEAGRIGGAVMDSTGAVVLNAPVSVTNLGTNAIRAYQTNEQGRFLATDLLPGEYQVVVEMPGFKKFQQTGIVVRVGDSLDIPIRLEVGQATESVTVTGETPLLQANSSSLGEVVENRMVTEMPLNARQPLSLVLLSPGVTPNRQMDNAAQPFNRAGNFSVSGGRGDSNEIMMDGTPNTVPEGSTGAFTAVTVFPTVEGTQEFKVQSNTFSAEYGRSGGGMVNIVTKSGTNAFHGSAFEFLRNSVLDANDFFSNRNSIPLASFKRNQFGAALGGPVRLPRLYDGRNRTFFFTSWESLVERGGVPFSTSVPTVKERNGDFTETFNAQARPVTIYDPLTTTFDNGVYTRQAFAGNVVPADRMNGIAKNIMALWPDPTGPGAAFTHGNNFNKAYTRPIGDHRFDVRLDQNMSDKHRLYGRYSQGRRTWTLPNVYGKISDPLARTYPSDPTSVKLGYTYTISASTLLDVRYAYNHLYFAQNPASLGYDITQLGLPKYVADQAQSREFPRLVFTDYGQGMGHTSNTQEGLQDSNIWMGSLSRTTGNHALKAGMEARRDRANRLVISPGDLSFTFNRNFTQGPNALTSSTTAGNTIASALLGFADTGRLSLATRRLTQSWEHAYYVQDDWRVSRRLTLNLGLRYDLQFPMIERRNNLNWFDPSLPSPLASQAPGLNLRGAVTFADAKKNPWERNNHDFAPRAGLAYQVSNNMVVRAAYGIFYSPHPYGTSDNVGVGFSSTTPFVGSIDGANPTGNLANPFPSGFVLPFGLGGKPSPAANLGLDISWFEPKSPTTYIQQWNFSLQRQLGQTLSVDLSYAGAKATHLPDVGYLASQLRADQLGPQVTTLVSNPFYGAIQVGTLAARQVRQGQLLSPFPQYTSAAVRFPTAASSIYHSLQLKTNKRFSRDLNFLLSYTAGKLIDDSSGLASWLEPATGHQDAYNRRADRSISDQDVAQRMVMAFTYGLPFGRNRLWGGWHTSGILVFQSGIPLAVTTTNTSFAGNAVLRPNNNGQSARLDGAVNQRLDKYFRTDVFSAPPLYRFGNTGRNLPDVRGPGARSMDLALYKDVKFREGDYLQIRAEAFNLTNTPEFENPDVALQSPAFGRITTQRNRPRQVQLGLRVVF